MYRPVRYWVSSRTPNSLCELIIISRQFAVPHLGSPQTLHVVRASVTRAIGEHRPSLPGAMNVVGCILLRFLLLSTTVDGLRPPFRSHITRRSAIGGLLAGSSLSLSAPPALGASVPQGPLCSPDVAVLQTAGAKQIIVIGTAHVSEESVALVQQVIREVQPETVMVELDKPRAVTLLRKERARRKGGGGGEAAGVTPSGASGAEQGIASFYQSLEEMGLQSGGEVRSSGLASNRAAGIAQRVGFLGCLAGVG